MSESGAGLLGQDPILDKIEINRLNFFRQKDKSQKSIFDQFFTKTSLSKFMASLFDFHSVEINILDPGAGIGSLFAACVEEILNKKKKPLKISVTAYEIDSSLFLYINNAFEICRKECNKNGVVFEGQLIGRDFIEDSVERLGLGLNKPRKFNYAIINPPYGRINAKSYHYKVLRSLRLDNTNYYSSFISLACKFLQPFGQLVSITPRSFCNGPYFHAFRKHFLEEMKLRRIHTFRSRSSSFKEENILQENIILSSLKSDIVPESVTISSNDGPDDEYVLIKNVPYELIISPNDPEKFIHIVNDEFDELISRRMELLQNNLDDLEIRVSTGKIVDFRSTNLITNKNNNAVPLIRPVNLKNFWIRNLNLNEEHIVITEESKKILIERGNYVILKRFTTKEEKKRIVAALLFADNYDYEYVALENRLNYFHRFGKGLDKELAKGLALYLNSTFVDSYFRLFNGHTQVNANDLRRIRYPSLKILYKLGRLITEIIPSQDTIDRAIEKELFNIMEENSSPLTMRKKIDEATFILRELGFPKQQLNERSALTLLALLDLKPDDQWSEAKQPLIGITPMMYFFEKNYKKIYKPNTRESVRRQSIHQFYQAGMVKENPDNPDRPINSGKFVYQIEDKALSLIRTFGKQEWEENLVSYKKDRKSLLEQYERARTMKQISLSIDNKRKEILLSPGGQNQLIKKIEEEFRPNFIPGGITLYIGDAGEKYRLFERDLFLKLGLNLDPHGKMPDVIIYDEQKKWLFLIEAVTSHGPIDGKRRNELEKLFKKENLGLVFVTGFLDKKTMVKWIKDISWETEIWIAESPTHMIHFDGIKFLGPFD